MFDPGTVIAAVAIQFALQTAEKAGGEAFWGVIGNRADAAVSGVAGQLRERLLAARNSDCLPANHDMERATLRAAILATHVTLQSYIDEYGDDALVDEVPEDWEPATYWNKSLKRIFKGDKTFLNALKHKLGKLSQTLQPSNDAGPRSTRFNNAMAEAHLSLAGSRMDDFAVEQLAELNPAQSAPDYTLREARIDFFETVSGEVMEQIARFGGWATERRERQVIDLLQPYFFGEDGKWPQNFALCYAEELRTDERLFKLSALLRAERTEDALAIIVEGQDAIFAEVKKLSEWLDVSIKEQFDELKQRIAAQQDAMAAEFDRLRNENTEEIRSQFGELLDHNHEQNEALQSQMSAQADATLAILDAHFAQQAEQTKAREEALSCRLEAMAEQIKEDILALRKTDTIKLDIRQRLILEGQIKFDIEEALKVLREASKSLQNAHTKDILITPRISSRNTKYAELRPFYFGEERDEFIGRSDEIEGIRGRLLSKSTGLADFKWAAVCGEAGTGKSRLALQIMREFAGDWPISGFVERSFLRNVETHFDNLDFLKGPTLFVIDYAGVIPECCAEFIEKCARFAKQAKFPVRLLVLVRRTTDRFFEAIETGGGEDLARERQVSFENRQQPSDTSGALVLGGLDPDDATTLMRQRIEDHHAAMNRRIKPRIPRNSELKQTVHSVDPQFRPLFVLMVADAIARGELAAGSGGKASETTRLDLFWTYLKRQYDQRWKVARGDGQIPTAIADEIDRHVTFALLSTMCRGLTTVGWERLIGHDQMANLTRRVLPAYWNDFDAPPGAPALDTKHLLSSIVGSEHEGGEVPYPILEPDLIAESLLLLVLDKEGAKITGPGNTAEARANHIVRMAWIAEPADAAFFAQSCAENFPDHAAQHGFFVPKDRNPDHAGLRARLFGILTDILLGPLQSAAATPADVERIDKLIAAFPFEPDAPVEAQVRWAEALSDLTDYLCFFVNRARPPALVRRLVRFEDKAVRGQKTFGEAARKPGLPASSEPAEGPKSGSDTGSDRDWELPAECSSQTADLAIDVLRRTFAVNSDRIFANYDPKVRLLLMATLKNAIASVYWEKRQTPPKKSAGNTKNFGLASVPLSDKERAERTAFVQRCDDVLSSSDLDEVNVALSASMQSSIIYAEEGADTKRGETAYQTIEKIANAAGFKRPEMIAEALNFLGNYMFNQAKLRRKDDGNDCDGTMDDVLATANNLLDATIDIPSIEPKIRDRVLGAWLDLYSRVIHFDRECGRDVLHYIDQVKERHTRFNAAHGVAPFSKFAVSYLAMLMGNLEPDGDEFTRIVEEYIRLVDGNSFERRSFYGTINNNLFFLNWKLLGTPGTLQEKVRQSFERMIADVGPKGRDVIADNLKQNLPSGTLDTDWIASLFNVLTQQEKVRLDPARKQAIELALTAQYLVEGRTAEVAEQAEALWQAKEQDGMVMALKKAQLIAEFVDISDPVLTEWRARTLAIATSALAKPVASPDSDNFLREVIAMAASFAEKEIASGPPADDWIEILEQDL